MVLTGHGHLRHGPQGAVQAYLWAMPQMTVAGQHHSNQFYGAKESTDFLYMYNDPSVPGMLTPNTIVQYIVNFYNFAENGPMVMETPGGQVVGMIMDYQQRFVADTGLIVLVLNVLDLIVVTEADRSITSLSGCCQASRSGRKRPVSVSTNESLRTNLYPGRS